MMTKKATKRFAKILRAAQAAEVGNAGTAKTVTVPVPVKYDSRICFGIAYFTSEQDAQAYAKATAGRTYNGGWFHGMATGRETNWDHVDPVLGPLFAVTD